VAAEACCIITEGEMMGADETMGSELFEGRKVGRDEGRCVAIEGVLLNVGPNVVGLLVEVGDEVGVKAGEEVGGNVGELVARFMRMP
jgi:hypothetical protein